MLTRDGLKQDISPQGSWRCSVIRAQCRNGSVVQKASQGTTRREDLEKAESSME